MFIEPELFIIHKNDLIITLSYSDGTFYLWETNTWTSEQWSSSSGFVKVREVYMLLLVIYGYLFTLRQHLFLNFAHVCLGFAFLRGKTKNKIHFKMRLDLIK